ncbi:hypothetical protein [Labilibaculum antarcticum]|uniref:Macro domain-containing protein n=1 Tax=Labilibaculum antarcticum TaxID=1717717 RepID=A0A1Y1CPI9_9BACT|nr:hypothetical protein [Labilibaculum antarcticum]BAX82358.1 hypothetical protein ALGA_4067 [Labilibaculum antarcticum]
MWFEKLVGFKEDNPDQVRANISIEGNKLISKVNSEEFTFGELKVSSLEDLRNQAPALDKYKSKISVSEEVGDVQVFHQDKANNGALFQAASQFNLLEMVGPQITPEYGVGIYENDRTQGPACAIACGAGTIYRNYFAEVNGQIGQSAHNQIDCLDEIGKELGNDKQALWEMKNGYVLANSEGLQNISRQIKGKSHQEFENLKGKLKIGIQWNSQVTIGNTSNNVTQAYCSALPVAYSHASSEHWESFARLILEATYEATFYAGLLNYEKTGYNRVFLTLVGGGAFGNEPEWITNAIVKTIHEFSNTPLDIRIVSYGQSSSIVSALVNCITG